MAKTKTPQPVDEENYDPDGLAYELEVARGLKSKSLSKRKAAEQIWTAIASGRACETTILTWCEYVAKQISANIIDDKDYDDRLRGGRALKCISLYDRDDEYRELRAFIELRLEFEELVTPGNRAQSRDKLTPMQIVSDWRSLGHFKDVKDRAAAKTVKREWDKIPPKIKSL
jgi:hypothetical protein